MKLHEIRCHLQEKFHRRAREDRRDYLIFFGVLPPGRRPIPYGPEAENSAVNYYVSCSIRPAVFLTGGRADNWNPVDRLDQKSSGGVYPRLNGG